MITTYKNFKSLSPQEMKEVKGGSSLTNPDCRCYRYDEPRPKAYCFGSGDDPICPDPLLYQYFCPCPPDLDPPF